MKKLKSLQLMLQQRKAAFATKAMLAAGSVAVGLTAPTSAFAFTVPSSGSFGYDIYDIVITKMLAGPLGWVGAAMLIVWGISNIMKQWLITVVCIVGATCIIKITTILTSLGALIQ